MTSVLGFVRGLQRVETSRRIACGGWPHRNVVRLEELGLYGIGMEPLFAIGQRALLITHPEGNVLWDCVPLLDEAVVEMVNGGTVLHWPEGADGKGVILSGDILQVVQDRRWVSFMYRYPNLIPLPASTVRRIETAVESFDFDRIYGAWWGKVVRQDAKAAVRRSAERYIRALEDHNE